MNNALKLCLAAIGLVGGTALVTAAALRPQDKGEGSLLPGPGEEHKKLGKMAGNWEQEYKTRSGPDMPWVETRGVSEAKTLLGGRYLMETLEFEMMGAPVEGLQILGYDSTKKEYISLWADSLSTSWVTSRGKEAADGSIEMEGTMVDVAGERPFRMVIRTKSDDLYESEMYDTIPPAGEVLVMTVTAKRKK